MKNYKDLLDDAEALLKDTTGHNSTGKIIAAAAVGLAVGAVLGVLLAPAAGTEIRSTISDSLADAGNTIKDKTKQGIDKLADLKTQAVDAVRTKVNGSSITDDSTAV